MIEVLLTTIHEIVPFYIDKWFFNDSPGWADWISTGANVVMAGAAIYAAVFGIQQYRHAVGLAEIDTLRKLFDELEEIHLLVEPKKDPVRLFLNRCELYAAALEKNYLTSLGKEFAKGWLDGDLRGLSTTDPFVKMLEIP